MTPHISAGSVAEGELISHRTTGVRSVVTAGPVFFYNSKHAQSRR